MGISTLIIQGVMLPDVVRTLDALGVKFLSSREGGDGEVALVIEGKAVPEVDKVMAYVTLDQASEGHSLRLMFEEARW